MGASGVMKYWIIVASRDHVAHGVAGGFCQACHGKVAPIKRMKPGDRVVYYSSKERFGEPEKCQHFTAIGTVKDERVYAHPMSETHVPFRRDMAFAPCSEAPIAPLIERLSFIADKRQWGAPFRWGILEVPRADFALIEAAMRTADH